MSLSIVIPVTDLPQREVTLRRMIREGIKEAFEIILVFDSVPELLVTKFVASFTIDNRFKFIKGIFGSPGRARNAGLKVATEDWVAFWDSDDYPIAGNFTKLLQEFSFNGESLVLGNFSIMSPTQKEINLTKKNDLLKFASNPGIWRFIFPRKLIENIEFPNSRIGEDLEFLVSALAKAKDVKFSDLIIYYYILGNSTQVTRKLERTEISNSLRDVHERTLGNYMSSNLTQINRVMIGLLILRMRVSLVKFSRLQFMSFRLLKQILQPSLVGAIGIRIYVLALFSILQRKRRKF